MAISVYVTGDKSTILHFKKIRARTGRFLTEYKMLVAKAIARRAKKLIEARARWRRTGGLAASIHIVNEASGLTGGRAVVEVMAPYASFVEEGTKPHIQPNSIIPLFRLVGHPGAKPMHFMRDAVAGTIPTMEMLASEANRKTNWFN